jgi:hypothetical protein
MKGLDDQLMSFSLKILVSASDGTAFTVSASEIFGGIVLFFLLPTMGIFFTWRDLH